MATLSRPAMFETDISLSRSVLTSKRNRMRENLAHFGVPRRTSDCECVVRVDFLAIAYLSNSIEI